MTSRNQKPGRSSHTSRNLLAIIGLVFIIGAFAFMFKNHSFSPSQLLKSEKTSQTSKKTNQGQTSQSDKKAKVDWKKQDETVKVPILMYHAIHVMDPSESASANLIVSPDTFESHIKALKEQGYYFLTPEEAYKVLSENVLPNGNKKIVWLTFDDGDADFVNAATIMKKHGAVGTNNVITSYADKDGFLTSDKIKELAKEGMSFQSHTVNHPDLSTQSDDSQNTEIGESKSWLDRLLGQDTIALAYPSGRYNDSSQKLAEKAGYKMAVTTNEGLASADNGLYALNRVRILPTTTADDLINTIAW
ncbi:polysaccharide deacetylase family protein [Streptococcus sobrinus]|uniref:polysaccharide deacetylase family protein n=1 Tax=Streptococcus sobrinus TaxID=1310 RepID=UPI0002F01BBD|nr:polysaccharide deacetylase family protein [Streptococcus sobrinus]